MTPRSRMFLDKLVLSQISNSSHSMASGFLIPVDSVHSLSSYFFKIKRVYFYTFTKKHALSSTEQNILIFLLQITIIFVRICLFSRLIWNNWSNCKKILRIIKQSFVIPSAAHYNMAEARSNKLETTLATLNLVPWVVQVVDLREMCNFSFRIICFTMRV